MHAFLCELEREKIEYKKEVSLASVSSFKVGGIADAIAYPDNEEKLLRTLQLAQDCGIPYKVLGNTSNILFSDNGFRGVIIVTKKISQIAFSCTDDGSYMVECGCGAMLPVISEKAAKHAVSGFEFACGIPGTVGGAVFMNAGAHGGAISDVIVSSRAYDTSTRSVIELDGDAHELSYRHSVYMNAPNLICLSAKFLFVTGDEESIRAKMRENMKKRRDTQPIDLPSAGSFFKRPKGYFAAKLIDDAGLKGLRVGGACISDKHAGFIVNLGGATASDILALSDMVIQKVKNMTGVVLEREIIFVE